MLSLGMGTLWDLLHVTVADTVCTRRNQIPRLIFVNTCYQGWGQLHEIQLQLQLQLLSISQLQLQLL